MGNAHSITIPVVLLILFILIFERYAEGFRKAACGFTEYLSSMMFGDFCDCSASCSLWQLPLLLWENPRHDLRVCRESDERDGKPNAEAREKSRPDGHEVAGDEPDGEQHHEQRQLNDVQTYLVLIHYLSPNVAADAAGNQSEAAVFS